MARVTVEDCIETVKNRFELVMYASHRARSLSSGAELTIDRDNDKNPVVALREIADKNLDLDELENSLVTGLQKHVAPEEPDEDGVELLEPDTSPGAENENDLGSGSASVSEGFRTNLAKEPVPMFNDDILPVDNNTLPSTE